MSHDIAKINGREAFFGTTTAWHKLGTVVAGAQNWEQAMKLASLDWEVEKRQLLSPAHIPVEAWGIFRTMDDVMLGCVGDQYTTIQNKYAFEFVDTLLEADDQARYISAGALGKGERIWCLAQIDGEFDVTGTGDVHKNYLLFTTSHDGSLASTCKLTTVRVVCNNTLTQALKMGGVYTMIKYTKDAKIRLEAARKLITGANVSIKSLEDKLRELSKRNVTREIFATVMKRIFGDWEEKSANGQAIARIETKIAEVAKLYESNDHNQFPEVKGTGYNLLNAVTEWTDHQSGVRHTDARETMSDDQIRAENSLFGTGASLKETALDVIYEVVMKDGSVVKMPRTDYHVKMSGSVLDAIIDYTPPTI
jgi:phage/plasmid-like protein (TIGR03299 family)